MIDLSSLNTNQRRAVEWGDGPLLVLAGPGSGKTRVLTYRIARLLDATPNERFRVLGITFTNKAAAEMRTRMESLLPEGRDRALLSTFHSFAAEILRQHGSHVGLRPDFTILSQEADREAALAAAIAGACPGDEARDYPAARLMPVVDRLLGDGVRPHEANSWLEKGRYPESALIAGVYEAYVSSLIAANQLDFGSLIVVVCDLLQRTPAISKQLRRVYKYVCVDEFQDTNAAQYRLLQELVPGTNPNLFVVADDEQVIYQWNGADPRRLQKIRADYSMDTIQLPEDYRCPPEVVRIANRLIKHNEDRAPDKQDLTANREAGGETCVRILRRDTVHQEIAGIRSDILKRAPDDRPHCVVLARTRKLLELAVADFSTNGLPACVSIRKTEFQSGPLRWLHSLLRLANSRQDREQVRRVCKAFYAVEGVDLRVEDVVARSSVCEGDFLRSWVQLALANVGVGEEARRVLDSGVIGLLERADHWGVIEASFKWFATLKQKEHELPDGALDDYDDEAATWTRLQQDIADEFGRSEVTLHSFLQGLDLRSKEPPAPPDAVRCYTIHTAKGLEFKHVYLMGLAEDQLPSWAAVKKGDASLEMREERRSCFVAITRAELSLSLSYASDYFGWAKRPSRFLSEMGVIKG